MKKMNGVGIIKNGIVVCFILTLVFFELKVPEIRQTMLNVYTRKKIDEIKSYFIFWDYWRVSKK